MKLRILAVPDCPNLAPLRQRLAEVLAGRADVTVTIEIISTVEQATRTGMRGSPTLLVNGADPFAEPGQPPSVSCRLYRDEHGSPTGAPTLSQLRAALTNATTAAAELRAWRARATPAEVAERAVHQAILRAFASTGQPPSAARLQQVAAANGATADSILTRLHEADVIRLDQAGAIRVAYPFSAVPTRHQVRLATGRTVSAMCAVDALGIPAMLGTDATITCIDPVTGERVVVTVHNGGHTWEPASAVVFASAAAGTGPSADCCCDHLNAFVSPATAHHWMSEHPGIPGELLATATAERLGRHIFGTLFDQH
ncbi:MULTISPECIES: alkylmercury lyase family protein [unclassified Crossiella]|uniref:alkylmercury lyase family protein n=1 Tax=unclassified Crossiella TaxID=2620835 RepID=UPI001FFF3191|nr:MULTISPECIES: alkylmercury lyase family protein [unclassified Crossiella]MCK2244173.1 organomercurial lyase [Crossiella sp. S99.2]MCK2257977.1 organomercurial lyase [Crossiella sp. S99.1]